MQRHASLPVVAIFKPAIDISVSGVWKTKRGRFEIQLAGKAGAIVKMSEHA